MLVLQNIVRPVFFLLLSLCPPQFLFSSTTLESFDGIDKNATNYIACEFCKKHKKLDYYLYIEDFISSFIEIPTSNVLMDSSTISSSYLAGRAPLYRKGVEVGTCSASFLCLQNESNIYTDISNYITVDNGLIVTWFTPTTLANLELDTIVHSMVTECIVLASTKVGVNPFYGQSFNLVVSSDNEKIYFKFTYIPEGSK